MRTVKPVLTNTEIEAIIAAEYTTVKMKRERAYTPDFLDCILEIEEEMCACIDNPIDESFDSFEEEFIDYQAAA